MTDNYTLVHHDGTIYSFNENGLTIGRGRENTIVLSDSFVSRSHARIMVREKRFWLRDENSADGTFVNDKRVPGQQEIYPGDILRVGNNNFRFQVVEAGTQTATKKQSRSVLIIATLGLIAIMGFMFIGLPRGDGDGSPLEITNDYSPPDVLEDITNEDGIALFTDPRTNENIEIRVIDVADQPVSEVNVIYLHGVEFAYEAYFVQDTEENTIAVALFTHNSSHEIKIEPNVMHAMNPDEQLAARGYLGDLGKNSKDFYQETITGEEMRAVLERAEIAIHAMMHFILPERVSLLFTLLTLPGDEVQIMEDFPDDGQWDHYYSYSAYTGRTETYIYIESQAPVMQEITVLENSGGLIRFSVLAIDPTYYPERGGIPKIDLIDHTIFLGPTSYSDLVYHYRIVDENGDVVIPWADVSQNSVCNDNGCRETELEVTGLPFGTYFIEAYATDEVNNDSGIFEKALLIEEDTTPEELTPDIELLAPNGGEVWFEGETYSILWSSAGVHKVDIAVAVGGKDKGYIATGLDAATGQYHWTIPDGFISDFGIQESQEISVMVTSSEDSGLYDLNDHGFTIKAASGNDTANNNVVEVYEYSTFSRATLTCEEVSRMIWEWSCAGSGEYASLPDRRYLITLGDAESMCPDISLAIVEDSCD